MDNILNSNSVLISIQPKWCELIANGKKFWEIRKKRPKLDTPFKGYIYCTKDKWQHCVQLPDKSYRIYDGKDYGRYNKELKFNGEGNGKIIGEFICDKVTNLFANSRFWLDEDILLDACLTREDVSKYASNSKSLFAWHISDLVIYDEPVELNSFVCSGDCDCLNCKECRWFEKGNGYNVESDCLLPYETTGVHPVFRAPQSWCYVERMT